jgi:copper chaperone
MTAAPGTTMMFDVDGMHCASCGLLIDDIVEELPGVVSSATDARTGRTVVTVAEGASVDPVTITEAITEAGYTARPHGPSAERREGS